MSFLANLLLMEMKLMTPKLLQKHSITILRILEKQWVHRLRQLDERL